MEEVGERQLLLVGPAALNDDTVGMHDWDILKRNMLCAECFPELWPA